MLNKPIHSAIAPIVIGAALAASVGVEVSALRARERADLKPHAITMAECTGKCHTPQQLAALIAKKNDLSTHLRYNAWKSGAKAAPADYHHADDVQVKAILNSYFDGRHAK